LYNRRFGSTKTKKANALFGLPSCNILERSLLNDTFNREEEVSQKELRGANIDIYISNGCRRGIKHFKGLPVDGQRNRTNAKTRKKFHTY
jgi:ribosomal protein S13